MSSTTIMLKASRRSVTNRPESMLPSMLYPGRVALGSAVPQGFRCPYWERGLKNTSRFRIAPAYPQIYPYTHSESQIRLSLCSAGVTYSFINLPPTTIFLSNGLRFCFILQLLSPVRTLLRFSSSFVPYLSHIQREASRKSTNHP